jgi:hypothetical protein
VKTLQPLPIPTLAAKYITALQPADAGCIVLSGIHESLSSARRALFYLGRLHRC